MSSPYQYSVALDFGGDDPNILTLDGEVFDAGLTNVTGVTLTEDEVLIFFSSDLISPTETDILDNVVASHDNTPDQSTNLRRTLINTPTYSASTSDDILAVIYSTTGICTITLPAINVIGEKMYIIVDEAGNAHENNIIVQTTGMDTIVGSNLFTINGDYNSIRIYNDLLNGWFIG